MKIPPDRTKNTLRLLEEHLDANERKRARTRFWLNVVWILGIFVGGAWMALKMMLGASLNVAALIALWAISIIIYMQLWKNPFSFSQPTGFRSALTGAFADMSGDRNIIKAVFLLMSPWLARLALLLFFALLRTIQIWQQ